MPKTTPARMTLRRLFSAVEEGMNLVGAVVIFIVMWMGVIEVGGRYLFNKPMPGHIELVELSIPFIAFLTVAYTQRVGGHIAVDLFTSRLHGKAKSINKVICWSIILLFCAALAAGTVTYAVTEYQIGDVTPQGNFPIWPSTSVIALGTVWLCIRIAIQLYDEVGILRGRQS